MTQENRSKSVEEVEIEVLNFRQSMNEWIMFLNQQNKEIREILHDLEKRIAKLEMDIHLRL